MENFEFGFDSAHPNAQGLMSNDFFWNSGHETAPFGSENGRDAAYGFRTWRFTNKLESPVIYLNELMREWEYPTFDWNELNTGKIKKIIDNNIIMDEAYILEQMSQLRTIFKNSEFPSINKIGDDELEKELREMVLSYLRNDAKELITGQDEAIIGVAFAQLVLEGYINVDLKLFASNALKRQQLTIFIRDHETEYRTERKKTLALMLNVISVVKTD